MTPDIGTTYRFLHDDDVFTVVEADSEQVRLRRGATDEVISCPRMNFDHWVPCGVIIQTEQSAHERLEAAMSNAERQSAFRERQTQAGLVRVAVWVPGTKKDAIRAAAADMRGS